jgi:hypothetical protein
MGAIRCRSAQRAHDRVDQHFWDNDVIAATLFPIRVLLQLVRAYAVWALFVGVMDLAFSALTSGGDLAVAARTVASSGAFMFGGLHLMVFASFRYCVAPRFPHVSHAVTFSIAAPLGTALLAGVWNLNAFLSDGDRGSIAVLPNWIAMHSDEATVRLFWSGVVTIVASAFGALMFATYRGGALNYGFAKFIGGLMVGRAEYEHFAQRETERLQREYEDYVSELESDKR